MKQAELLYFESVSRTQDLCRAVLARAADGDPVGMLDEVGNFLSNLDAVDDEGIALFERGRAALGRLVARAERF